MKTVTLAATLALATIGLAACTPKTDAGNNAAAADTLTLNEEGDAGLGNSDTFTDNSVALDNSAAPLADNTLAPAEGNAL